MSKKILATMAVVLGWVITSVATAGPYSDAVLADSPLGYWRLDDVGNVAADATGNHNSDPSNVDFGVPGLLAAEPGNLAVSIIGDNRIVVPGFDKFTGGTGYTAEYWLNLNNLPMPCCTNIFGDGESGGDFFFMNYVLTSGQVRPHFSFGNTVSINSPAALVAGQTYHVVTTWDQPSGIGRIYIDGSLNLEQSVGSNFPGPATANNPLYFGRDGREPGRADFVLDEVAFYNKALSADRVQQHYALGSGNDAVDPGEPDRLVSYWNFDSSAVGTDPVIDQAGSADGTFVGSATRTTGLIGLGAAQFNDTNGDGVNVGNAGFSFISGITVEAVFSTDYDGLDQAEFFRKEDGGNRILLSFQTDFHTNNAFGQLVGDGNGPGISLGLNVGGAYKEMDVTLDGQDGRPSLADVADGQMHHIVASYDAASGKKQMYLDGLLIAEVIDSGNLATGGGAPALIGASGGGEPFDGTLDEVAIYREALSADEVAAHYANVLAGRDYFNPIPEPGTMTLAILGLLGLATMVRRRRLRR